MTLVDQAVEGPQVILVIVADQVRADHFGFGGSPFGLTPNLDALAGRGTVFDRAFVTNPTCMPSRATIATGRWPSTHGTFVNGVALDPTAETFMGALRREGWHTAAVGKLHFQTMGWPTEPHQVDEIGATNPWSIDPQLTDGRSCWDGQRDDFENLWRHRDGPVTLPDDYYGFGSVDLVAGHGDMASGHYWQWVRRHGFEPEAAAGYENAVSRSEVWDDIWVSAMPSELSTSRFVAEHTCRQIELAAARDGPTMIFVSFPDPHHPYCPSADYAGLLDVDDVELPASFHQDPARLPPHIAAMLASRGTLNADPMIAFAATEQQYREAYVHSAGLIRMLDDAVGDIWSTVERAGLAQRATVLFTADHGDLFGEHGLMLKQHVHYEPVTRVPLFLTGPGVGTRRTSSLVSLADLAPSVLDLADVVPFRGVQGRSLRDLATGVVDSHRDAVLIEEDIPYGTPGLRAPVRMRTVVTDDGRLTLYHGEAFGECYDRAADRGETNNVFGEPSDAALEDHLRSVMLDELMSLSDESLRMQHGA